jgi:hypothetical protein
MKFKSTYLKSIEKLKSITLQKNYDKIMTKDCAQNNVRNTTNLKEPQVPQIAQIYLRIVVSECQI